MAAQSVEDFLEVPEANARTSHQRSRSGGYQDFLEDQLAWERRDRERQMRRYYTHKPQATDRLYVPAFDTPPQHRRVRSQEEIKEAKDDPVRTYNVREAKPLYDLNSEAPLPSQLPVRIKPSRHRPKISVEVHQEPASASSSTQTKTIENSRGSPSIATVSPSRRRSNYSTTTERSPRSSYASPRSPSSNGLQLQYSMIQNKFADISTTCAPNVDIEAARPQDLSFSKISDEVRGYAFQLKVWGHTVDIENMDRFDRNKKKAADMVSRTLDRLFERANQLCDACSAAGPRDLRMEYVPMDDSSDDDYDDSFGDEDEEFDQDVTESPAFIIHSHLKSIGNQIQTLSRLTRVLQEATPAGEPEVDGIRDLVKEVDKYFGREESLKRYQVDETFKGRKGLEEARANARR